MKCFFACALAGWQGQLSVVLDSGATVDDLLREVRDELVRQLASANQGTSEASTLNEAWWRSAPVGIFGERCDRSRVLVDGDRVEMYLALKVDPKAARRERAQPHQTEKGRNPLTRKPGR